jgi:hypothetical protein
MAGERDYGRYDAGNNRDEQHVEPGHVYHPSPWLTFRVAEPPLKAVEFILTAAIGLRTCAVKALSDHVVEAKWKADVELLLMVPPLLSEAHTTPVEVTRCKSSKVYWTVTSLFAVELVKVREMVVGLPPSQFKFAAGEAPGVVEIAVLKVKLKRGIGPAAYLIPFTICPTINTQRNQAGPKS